MRDSKRVRKVLLLHLILLPTLLYAFSFFVLAPKEWVGVDETVVEKIAADHGRAAKPPIINTDKGDLLLFLFLLAGGVGGFAAGYYWRELDRNGRQKEDV